MVKNLKELRNKKGISQQQLADVIGTSQQSINKYENHSIEPDIDTLILMAKFFNTSVDYLIGNTRINRIIENVKPNDLNQDETELIENYRKLDKNRKQSIHIIINNYLNWNSHERVLIYNLYNKYMKITKYCGVKKY